jgi:hypothetical protein
MKRLIYATQKMPKMPIASSVVVPASGVVKVTLLMTPVELSNSRGIMPMLPLRERLPGTNPPTFDGMENAIPVSNPNEVKPIV